jgi:uncharacterized DUF497 family protein
MAFEWDESKRRANLAKHGVDFVKAAKALIGDTLERPDGRRDYGEERIVAIGAADGDVVVVVYTRRGDRLRIISARLAGRNERKAYRARIGRPIGADEG